MFRIRSLLRRAVPALPALLLSAALAAQSPSSGAAAAGPPTGGAVRVGDLPVRVVLLTMGPGDAVWERFGHNAIWVEDPNTGVNLAFNYGMFDFRQENFFLNFARGKMLYWMEGFDPARMVDFYQAQNRSVWAQELNLTPRQAAELSAFLQWNSLQQNRFYRYDYYRDNCSTRVRDAIDRVLGGAIRASSNGTASGTTYRWHTARLTGGTGGDVPIYTGLMGGLGPAADRPISRWEEMFLPMKLRDGIRALQVRDESGRTVPLVRSEREIFRASRPAEQAAPPKWTLGYLAAGVLLAAVLATLGVVSRRSGAARGGFAALGGLWLLLAGVGGVTLLLLWLLTDHSIAYRNENLLQLSPLALPLVVLLPALAYGKRWAGKWAVRLALAVAALSVLGFALQALPGVDQGNGEIIALALPVNVALAWVALRLSGWARARTTAAPPAAREREKATA
jgi:hypothetical protein